VSFKSSITGVDQLKQKMFQFEGDAVGATVETVQMLTLQIHSVAVKSLQANTDGTAELRYKPTRWAFASFPGDPPNTDTGRAVQSIKFDFIDNGRTGLVGTNLRYLAWLEFGTKKVAARPWLAPAVEEVRKGARALFTSNVSGAIYDVSRK